MIHEYGGSKFYQFSICFIFCTCFFGIQTSKRYYINFCVLLRFFFFQPFNAKSVKSICHVDQLNHQHVEINVMRSLYCQCLVKKAVFAQMILYPIMDTASQKPSVHVSWMALNILQALP